MTTNGLPDMTSQSQFDGMPPGGIATAIILALAGYLAKYLHRSGVVTFRRMLVDIPAIMLIGFITFMVCWAFAVPQWQAYIILPLSGWIGTRLMDMFAKFAEAKVKAQVGE